MENIYINNAATSFPKPESVYKAIDDFNRYLGANPGRGSNGQTVEAGSILLDAREALAALFKAEGSENIAFTANVTEAINLGLQGLLQPGDHVITTSMEHNSVARPLYAMSRLGVEWTAVPCNPDGGLDVRLVEKAIRPNTRLICMLHASNLTGTIMPIADVGKIARDRGLVFMVDAAQTAGILELDINKQYVDILAFTGHKALLGPQGTGGIYIRPGIRLKPLLFGGTGSLSESLEQPDWMPDRFESGTPNTPGIAGLLAGVNFVAETGIEVIHKREQDMTEALLQGLQVIPRVQTYGAGDSRQRTAVIAFNIEGMDCGDLTLRLEYEYGIITRSGLHCAYLAHKTLGTLQSGACRLSPGFFTSDEQIETVLRAIYAISHSA
ncbi:MAG: aminotransferase class V-fold PLP-dependent enzyme [Syntrophomonadaceae bacterium]|nr:aminotransferase class V-fold PLP-dependent enzyme [Syntrophomonadaceae bacterium]